MCRLDDVTRPLYFRGNRLSLMFRVGRDGVLLLSGIGKKYSFGYGFSMKSEIVDWDERLIDTLCREVCSLHSCEISHRA